MKILRFEAIWCPSCLIMKQRFNKIDTNGYEVLIYDYDDNEDIVTKYNIGNILPVIILEDSNGNELTRIVGEKKEIELKEIIDKYRSKK